MKKTLLLTHEYYPFKGGVARYCYNLFKNFDNEDYLVVTDNKDVKNQANIIQTRLTWPFIKPSWLLTYLKIKKIIKKHKIEQIFTPNILPLGSLAYFLKIPYVISLHGLDINLAIKNKPTLTKKILDRARVIVVNTKNTANILSDFGNYQNKIYVLYPAFDEKTDYDEVTLEAFRKKLDIGQEKIIFTLGRLNKRKGQDLVIDAMDKIKEEYNLKYFIVGDGQEKENLKNLIKKYKLKNRVFIFDNIEDSELVYFFKLADIFVMPHRYDKQDIEGFGTVFLEAAKFKLPIIAGNSGGVKEMFNQKNQAILLEESSLKYLIKALRYLLNNPQEADKLAENAYKRTADFDTALQQSAKLKDILK